MGYVDTLSTQQKQNIAIIKDEAKKAGITNPYAVAGILAIVSKESSFIPKSENLNYSATRLQQVFGLSSSKASELAGKPEAIGNAVYGGKYGNSSTEGYKYRGRGFNQLTFKGNYDAYGKIIGEDLVSNPDKVNTPLTGAKVLMAFNKKGIQSLKSQGKLSAYNADDINDFKNLEDATMAFYHVTAGTGKSVSYVKGLKSKDSLGGMTKALARVEDLFNYSYEAVKNNPLKTILVVATLGLVAYFISKQLGKGKSKLLTK